MKIRELFQKTDSEILTEIFSKLPTEITNFCVACGSSGIFSFASNNFDNSLAWEKFEPLFNAPRKAAETVLHSDEIDELLHVLYLRYHFGRSIPFDTVNEGIDVLIQPNRTLEPNMSTLNYVGLMAKTYPILSYHNDKGVHNEFPKSGFVIFKDIRALKTAINSDRNGYAKQNYPKELIAYLTVSEQKM